MMAQPSSVEESMLRVKAAADRVRSRLEAAGRYGQVERLGLRDDADEAEPPAFFGSPCSDEGSKAS